MSGQGQFGARLAIGALGLLLCTGCAGRRGADGRGPGGGATAAPPGGTDSSRTSTIIESMHRGIELHRLLDRPYRGRLEPILSQYSAEPLGVSEEQLARLRDEGLRIVAVPVDDEKLEDLIVDLTGETVVERVRMGVVPEWRPAATAPRLDGSRFVKVGGEVGAFAGGRFRLLLRAYPLLGYAPPVLRLELMVQFHQPRRDPLAPDPVREERMGVYVPSSALAIDLDGKWAVVVTAEDPSVTWGAAGVETPAPAEGAGAGKSGEAGGGGESSVADGAKPGEARPAPPQDRVEGPGQGSGSPRIRTTGEEALISEDGATRFVLIFVPRLK